MIGSNTLYFVIVLISSSYSLPECRMPTGYAGECRYLDKCKPLQDLVDKKLKTEDELLYLRESSCGTTSNFRYKVCCPPQSEWSKKLSFKPILFPEIVQYMSEPGQNLTNFGSSTQATEVINQVNQNTIRGNTPWSRGDLNTNVVREECGVDSSYSDTNTPHYDGNIVEADRYPWLVLLEYTNMGIMCGGSLVSLQYVLTAAHCIETPNGQPTFAHLSEYNLTSFPTDIVEVDGGGYDTISNTIISVKWSAKHPLFNRRNYQHDIGMVKLSEKATYSDFVRPICLPRYNYVKKFQSDTYFVTAGWNVNGVNTCEVKKEATIPYMPTQICKRSVPDAMLSNKQICTLDRRPESCVSDNGGPLMYESDNYYMIVGITSYSSGSCGKQNHPNVNTNVYEYLDWIDSMME